MVKGKLKVKAVKKVEVVKKVASKEIPKVVNIPKDLEAIRDKRDKLIAEIQPTLLTKSQLKSGGSAIRVMYMKETGLSNVISEINDLGKELHLQPIGLGDLRK